MRIELTVLRKLSISCLQVEKLISPYAECTAHKKAATAMTHMPADILHTALTLPTLSFTDQASPNAAGNAASDTAALAAEPTVTTEIINGMTGRPHKNGE